MIPAPLAILQKKRTTITGINLNLHSDPCNLTEEEDNRIRNRRETFIWETGIKKTVLITMVTSFGLAPSGYSDDIQCQLTMADLFR